MSYSTAEALVLAEVRSVTGFSSANAVSANWKILNSGKGAVYAITRYGAQTAAINFITYAGYTIDWPITVEVWQRYADDATTQTTLYNHVRDIISALQTERRYDDATNNVISADIVSIGMPIEKWKKGGGPAWLEQDINIIIKEQVDVTFT